MSDIGALGGIGNYTISALVAAFGGASQAAAATGIARTTLQTHIGGIERGLSAGLTARLDSALDKLSGDMSLRVELIQGNLVHMSQIERQFALIDYRAYPDVLESSIRQAREIATRKQISLPQWALGGDTNV